jgi:hypothetical protein
MCLETCAVGGVSASVPQDAEVVFDVVLPSQRPVVGGKRSYDIDVREFLVTNNNALIARTIERELLPFAAKLSPDGAERFRRRGAGAFDFRARVIVGWVLENVRYRAKRGRDPWQFPDETLSLRSGDCEDIAFLVASLLLASGVSGYHVRVALGEVVTVRGERFEHAWVLYKSESGSWRLVEPLARRHGEPTSRAKYARLKSRSTPAAKAKPARFSGGLRYRPWYLLNADHLWAVPQADHPGSLAAVARRKWSRMDPKFAGETHKLIVESALADVAPPDLMSYLRGRFKNLIVATIDESDWVNPLAPSSTPYNPLDHFDNGCIDESWSLVERRLSAFTSSGRKDFECFAEAIHGIADFYAHSSYLHFAWLDAAQAERGAKPYPGKTELDANSDSFLHDAPYYGPLDAPGLVDFDLHRFSKNPKLWNGGVDAAIEAWDGKLISGRYAQDKSDAQGSFVDSNIEKLNVLPAKWRQPARGALPHHDEIAVDAPDPSHAHRLYDVTSYRQQFQWRVATAIRHIRQAYTDGVPY